MKDFEKESEVIANIIRLLNECLKISIQNNRKSEAIRIVQDMRMCRKELRRIKKGQRKMSTMEKGDLAKDAAK
jgi:hypothetical protein